ncbi:PerC family transcriptional regulator [Aeromonas veronii]|uniref:PerC family transcriptional regulator n=1 Tax=Aeromonas veronii TaxID=654 RepID=UPI003D1D1454
MSQPFKPMGYAHYRAKAQELEEQGQWARAAEVWARAMKTPCSMTNWREADARRLYCRRKHNQQRDQQQETV